MRLFGLSKFAFSVAIKISVIFAVSVCSLWKRTLSNVIADARSAQSSVAEVRVCFRIVLV